MFEFNFSLEQEQRRLQAIDEHEQYLDNLAEKQNQIRAAGEFDGKCGLPPKSPQDQIYWQGYTFGLQTYWLNKLGLVIEPEF